MREHLQGVVLVAVMIVATIITVVIFAASDLSAKPNGEFVVAGVTTTKFSMTGQQVEALQGLLAAGGYEPGDVDGIYGEATRLAVERARSGLGLPVNANPLEVLEGLQDELAQIFTPDASVVEPVDTSDVPDAPELTFPSTTTDG